MEDFYLFLSPITVFEKNKSVKKNSHSSEALTVADSRTIPQPVSRIYRTSQDYLLILYNTELPELLKISYKAI